MFLMIGRVVSRYWYVVLLLWAGALPVVALLAPSWDDVVLDREFAYMPAMTPSRQGEAAFAHAFPDQYNPSTLGIVVHRTEGPLTAKDLDFIEQDLKPGLMRIADEEGGISRDSNEERPDRSIIASITTFKEPGIGALLLSDDGKASMIVVQLTAELLEIRNWKTLDKIDRVVEQLQHDGKVPAGLAINDAGNAAIGRDVVKAQARTVFVVQVCTLLFVVVLLLLIYRSPLLCFVPLLTMFIAVETTLKLLALAAEHRLITVFQGMQVYIVIVMYGTGIDYCLFLLSRCKEELDGGAAPRDAVAQAIARVGVPLTASAATVATGIGMMSFASFGEYHNAGLAIFFSITVGWAAALTSTPALLRLLGAWAFRVTARAMHGAGPSVWDRLSAALKRRPAAILLGAAAMMIPFAVVAYVNRDFLDYDILERLPDDAPSRVGSRVLEEQFSGGMINPVIVMLEKPGFDFGSDEGQDAIESLTNALMRNGRNWALPMCAAFPGRWERRRPPRMPSMLRPIATEELPGKNRRCSTTSAAPMQPSFSWCWRAIRCRARILTCLALLKAPCQLLPSSIKDARFNVLGFTSSFHDLRQVTTHDQVVIQLLVVASVFVILVALLWSFVIPVYLIVSVLLSYFCTLGITFTLFWVLAPAGFGGLDWKVPIFLFVILMAVGADYNIFLLTRVHEEEKTHEPVEAVISAMIKTGHIITSCGIIMAGTFAALLTSSLVDLKQLGFALSFGILLDTFLVRPILVPAFLIFLRSRTVPPPRVRTEEPAAPSFALIHQDAASSSRPLLRGNKNGAKRHSVSLVDADDLFNCLNHGIADAFFVDAVHLMAAGQEMLDQVGVPLGAGAAGHDGVDLLGWQTGPIRARRHHGVAGVGHAQDACQKRNGVAGQAVWIAQAVEAFVVIAHAGTQMGQVLDLGNDGVADERMLADVRLLFFGEGALLLQHAIANADLADIVEQAGQVEVAENHRTEAHVLAQANGHARDPFAVAAGEGALGADGFVQAADHAQDRVGQVFLRPSLPAMIAKDAANQQHDLEIFHAEKPLVAETHRHHPEGSRFAEPNHERALRLRLRIDICRGRRVEGAIAIPMRGELSQLLFGETAPPHRQLRFVRVQFGQ